MEAKTTTDATPEATPGQDHETSASRLEEIRERSDRAIAGPWGWFGNTESGQVYLGTPDRGRLYLMAPQLNKVGYIWWHEASETYDFDEARKNFDKEFAATHDIDEMDLEDFINDLAHPEVRTADLRDRDGRLVLSRGVWATCELAFQDAADPERDRNAWGGGRMVSHREMARYEVLGGQTRAEAGLDPDAGRHNSELYREDIVGIDNPEADLIANSQADIEFLLAEVDRLNAQLDDLQSKPGQGPASSPPDEFLQAADARRREELNR